MDLEAAIRPVARRRDVVTAQPPPSARADSANRRRGTDWQVNTRNRSAHSGVRHGRIHS